MSLIFEAFAALIQFFYKVIPNYAIAIVLLTIAVRLVLFPLTAKQARSMQAMQRVQPELKRLQAKYKDDRQKLNEELMKFYKENNINPLAGCLPLVLQLPLFIVLFRVISGLTHTVVAGALVVGGTPVGPAVQNATVQGGSISGGSVAEGVVTKGELKDARVVVAGKRIGTLSGATIRDGRIPTARVVADGETIGTFRDITVRGGQVVGSPKYISKSSDLYESLRKSEGEMRSFGIDLSNSASSAEGGFGDIAPYWLLVALVIATGYYQQRQMTARNPQAAQNPQTQMMGKVFPVVFGFISFSIAAGVVVYFVVSNLWQIGQQALIFRNVAPAGGGTGAIEATAREKKRADGATKPAKPAKQPKTAPPARTDRGAPGTKQSGRHTPRGTPGRRKGRR